MTPCRVLLFTGKGGVGKTSVAGAFDLAEEAVSAALPEVLDRVGRFAETIVRQATGGRQGPTTAAEPAGGDQAPAITSRGRPPIERIPVS